MRATYPASLMTVVCNHTNFGFCSSFSCCGFIVWHSRTHTRTRLASEGKRGLESRRLQYITSAGFLNKGKVEKYRSGVTEQNKGKLSRADVANGRESDAKLPELKPLLKPCALVIYLIWPKSFGTFLNKGKFWCFISVSVIGVPHPLQNLLIRLYRKCRCKKLATLFLYPYHPLWGQYTLKNPTPIHCVAYFLFHWQKGYKSRCICSPSLLREPRIRFALFILLFETTAPIA
jgi:hypothetical protein